MQVFKKAVLWFSIGGEYYVKEPVSYVYMADTILKEPRNVSIRLNGQIGRFVKMELYFSNVWISISEVTFDSTAAEGSFSAESEPITAESTRVAFAETSTDANLQGKWSEQVFPSKAHKKGDQILQNSAKWADCEPRRRKKISVGDVA